MDLKARLKHELLRRKTAEDALKQSKRHYNQMLIQSRDMQKHLRRLSHQILLAQEKERKEIGGKLQDEIAQTLTGINVHLETLKTEAAAHTKGLKKKIVNTQRLVGKSMNIVHRFARELHPKILDDLGLIPALSSHIRDFTKRTRIPIRFTAFRGVEQLDGAKQIVLYRIAQSALANIAQHAKASTVSLSILELRGTIRMEIKDNGISFQADRTLTAKRHKRFGILGMRERAQMVGGSFTIESAPGKGTTVSVTIPFTNGTRSPAHESNHRPLS